jgi:transcriptional regulator with XRE-family HTH domain
MISELENGKRAYISTTELIVLAAALNVAPVALLYPAPYEEEIEVLPGVRMLTIAAAERFSGNIDPLMFDHDEEFVSNMLELSRARQLREIQRSRRNLAEQLKITGDVIPGSVRETLQVEHARLSKLYAELRSEYGG